MLFFCVHADANDGKTIKPLQEKEVKSIINQLDTQGILKELYSSTEWNQDDLTFDSFDPDSNCFWLKGIESAWFYLYKADINNDTDEEYILASASGSGQFFDIVAIYKVVDGKFIDLFDEIKLPMRRLIRDWSQADYDLEEGYVGFMYGTIMIEKEGEKIYFIIIDKEAAYKFLWDEDVIKLVGSKEKESVYF